MPLPHPSEGESQSEFMSRCMGSEGIEEFDSQEQKVAVCLSKWRAVHKSEDPTEGFLSDILDRVKSFMNLNKSADSVSDEEIVKYYSGQKEDEKHRYYTDEQGNLRKIKKKPVAKSLDTPLRLVTGVVLEPEIPDLHGDVYSAEEIRKAAHGWMKRSQTIGLQHVAKAKSTMVESWIAPVDFELNGEVVKKGTWLLTTHVEDDAEWDAVLKNGFTGYSIGGVASVEDLSNDN